MKIDEFKCFVGKFSQTNESVKVKGKIYEFENNISPILAAGFRNFAKYLSSHVERSHFIQSLCRFLFMVFRTLQLLAKLEHPCERSRFLSFHENAQNRLNSKEETKC